MLPNSCFIKGLVFNIHTHTTETILKTELDKKLILQNGTKQTKLKKYELKNVHQIFQLLTNF